MKDSTDTYLKIESELAKTLYKQLKLGLWAESIAAIALVAALWGSIEKTVLITWLLFNLLLCGLARHVLIFFFEKSTTHQPLSYQQIQLWVKLFLLGVIFSGISWGMSGFLLMVEGDMVRQQFVAFLLIGMTSASTTYYSPYRHIYAAFLLLAFTPFTLWLFMQGDIFIVLGCLAFVYISILLIISFYYHSLLIKSLKLRFENTDLIENLSETTISLQTRTKELEESYSLLRATLESTTDGILAVSFDRTVVDFNKKFLEMWKLPLSIAKGKDLDKKMLEHVVDQLIDPAGFISRIDYLYQHLEEESFDELLFKDGRIFERHCKPKYLGERCVGKVWSFRDITVKKLMEQKLLHQANFDALTNLPNRTLLMDRLSQVIAHAKRKREHIGILFLDLDYFKMVNDTLGHAIGDKTLIETAERLKKCLRGNDTLSRQGGDEFVIVLSSTESEDDIVTVVQRCLNIFKEPFLIDNHKFTLTISIGISIYPRDGENAEELIRDADIAMYRAKEVNRGSFQFFTKEMNKRISDRLKFETRLREALENDQFSLVYQPILDLRSNQIVGAEALLRWFCPAENVWISPSTFIPIADDSRLIIPIGEWVLKHVIQQLCEWKEKGINPVPVTVNISTLQFNQPDFLPTIERILQNANCDPHYLVIELTESILIENVESNIKTLKKLRKMGILSSLDDFGTGYSSLNYLKQLPVDTLKIACSFIKGIPTDSEDIAITQAIIALAERLNLKVIAEGVETKEQMEFLRAQECDQVQGFYFYKPLSAKDIALLLKQY